MALYLFNGFDLRGGHARLRTHQGDSSALMSWCATGSACASKVITQCARVRYQPAKLGTPERASRSVWPGTTGGASFRPAMTPMAVSGRRCHQLRRPDGRTPRKTRRRKSPNGSASGKIKRPLPWSSRERNTNLQKKIQTIASLAKASSASRKRMPGLTASSDTRTGCRNRVPRTAAESHQKSVDRVVSAGQRSDPA
jgi:hypothetical protein